MCFLSVYSFGINKQKLDSLIYPIDYHQTYRKVEFIYDINGNLILTTNYNRDSADISWTKVSKAELDYDLNANVTVSHYYEWNNSNNQWINQFKTEYTYNSNNDWTLLITSRLDTNVNQLRFWDKAEITYDVNGNKTLETYSTFYWDINQWEYTNKYEHSYNNNRKEILNVSSNWNTSLNQWRNNYKGEYTYDITGNLTELIQYDFWQNNTWGVWNKLEYIYDNNAHLTEYKHYAWSYDKNQLVPSSKSEYSYTPFEEISTVLNYVWDTTTVQFKNNGKNEYTYDSYHNISEEMQILFVNNQWDTILKNKFIYDNTIEADQLVLSPIDAYGQFIDNLPFSIYIYGFYQNNSIKHKLLEFRDELWSSNKAIYYYSDYVAGTNEIDNAINKVMIYPNPANEKITVDLSNSKTTIATIKLMNIVGETMLVEQTNDVKYQLDLSSVPNGVYLIQVQSNNSTSTNRIVVQR